MKLNTHHDLRAPVSKIYEMFADTERWEHAAVRRGIDIKRTVGVFGLQEGATWDVKASFREKQREATVTLTELARPKKMVFLAKSDMFTGEITLEMSETETNKTRADIEVEVKATTLAGRLMLQSFKLAKGQVQKRFASRIKKIMTELDHRLADPYAS